MPNRTLKLKGLTYNQIDRRYIFGAPACLFMHSPQDFYSILKRVPFTSLYANIQILYQINKQDIHTDRIRTYTRRLNAAALSH